MYIDLMLDLPDYINNDRSWRIMNTISKILEEMPRILRKYKLENFDTEGFVSETKNFFKAKLEGY